MDGNDTATMFESSMISDETREEVTSTGHLLSWFNGTPPA
jgi:hypothetical protein